MRTVGPGPGERTIELREDSGFQERQFQVARVAGALFVVIAVAALLGVLGTGPLSDATARGRGMSVDYDRFLRFATPTEIEVSTSGGSGTTELRLSAAYLEGFDVENITPEPDSQSAVADRIVFTFDERPPSTVTLSLTPREIGLQKGTVSLAGGGSTSYHQLVYP